MTILSDINEIWKSLSDVSDTSEGHVFLRFKTCINNLEVWVGIDKTSGQEEVKFSFNSTLNFAKTHLSQGGGFRTEIVQETRGSSLYVEKKNDGNLQLFTLMISDVIQDLADNDAKNAAQSFEMILRRIQQWQDFMRKIKSNMALEDEIGLFGELCCLDSILELGFNPLDIVSAWKGPDHGIHDFLFSNCDIEVKSTLAEENFPVRIFNQEQLDTPSGTSLWLCGYRLVRSQTEGSTLFSLIESIREKLENSEGARDKFDVLVSKAGWLDEYKNRMQNRFVMSKTFYWKVHKTFPRIVPSDLMQGITSVSYQIELAGRTVDAKNIQQVFEYSMESENVNQ